MFQIFAFIQRGDVSSKKDVHELTGLTKGTMIPSDKNLSTKMAYEMILQQIGSSTATIALLEGESMR
jgi:hypothetical protein